MDGLRLKAPVRTQALIVKCVCAHHETHTHNCETRSPY